MTRLPDWRARLRAYLDTARRERFGYGRTDCALFIAGAVEAMTGEDHARDFRGRYTSLAAGLTLLHAHGFIDHVDLVASMLPEVRPAHMAEVGDIAVVDSEEGEALGLVAGSRILCWREAGLVTISMYDETDPACPRPLIKRAFRV